MGHIANEMKRTISALALCSCLLVLLLTLFLPRTKAKTDILQTLLDLPAPPPPNPLVKGSRVRDKNFYDKKTPPPDDAPIEDLLEYWTNRTGEYYGGRVRSMGEPSPQTVERLLNEASKDPRLLSGMLDVLPRDKTSAESIKNIYEQMRADKSFDKTERAGIKDWLKFNTPLYADELERVAAKTKDNAANYIDNNDERTVLALTRQNFDLANPILSRMYADRSQPVTQVLATWALYRRALDTDSLSDIERYRSELMKMVENRNLPDGVRDKANDAITMEKDFPGRDDWTISLFEDETLVGMPQYTMLTTLAINSDSEQLPTKFLDLLKKTNNPTVRAAAIRNLMLYFNRDLDPAVEKEIITSMLPLLEDPKWAKSDNNGALESLIDKLGQIEIPESVPGLIKALDEKPVRPVNNSNRPTNTSGAMANAANAMANAAAAVARAANAANAMSNIATLPDDDEYVYNRMRTAAVNALAFQKDPRAVPALRRILPEGEVYQQTNVIRAILACKGFTVGEQLEGLEIAAKSLRGEMDGISNAANVAYTGNTYVPPPRKPLSPVEIKKIVGESLMNQAEVTDDLARAVVERIGTLDKQNKPLAEAFRKMILRWQSPAINLLMLADLKRGAIESDAVVKLLAMRKDLREKQSTDVFGVRTGGPLAVGVAACLLEDQNDGINILDNADVATKTAFLACSRLIRMPLPVDKVAPLLASDKPQLAIAAERYLESEDSPAARNAVLSKHGGEARLLGATSAFFAEGKDETTSETLYALFASMGDNSLYNGWYGSGNDGDLAETEKRLREEVKKNEDLVAVYAYDRNYVRIYKDKVVFSWDEDDSRYRERKLEKHEFDELRAYIAQNKLDELPPFLNCGGEYCTATELVMLGKAGGRRLYINGETPKVIAGLEKYFADLKQTPAALKYTLSSSIPGLEIVIASDDLHAETVWKENGELRIAASLSAVRKKIESDIEKVDEESEPDDYEETERKKTAIRDKHEYDGYSWYRITDNGAEPGAAQPNGVEYIPIRDGLSVPVDEQQWKARTTAFEIRGSEDGLFKIARSRATKILTGNYGSPVVSTNGRWVLLKKVDDEYVTKIVRVDLMTGREYPVQLENYYGVYPSVFVPTLNKFLISRSYEGEYYEGSAESDDTTQSDSDPENMFLVDPATGAVTPIAGEFRPLDQQTFRPLQSTGKPNEFWAAMPDDEKNETNVGIYETRTFSFKPLLKVPKIKFNSMDMYADEAGGKLYFVYRGHLLSLPLKRQ